MRRLINWSVRRSGATMTIEGTEAYTGKLTKLSSVGEFGPRDGKLLIEVGGDSWELVL